MNMQNFMNVVSAPIEKIGDFFSASPKKSNLEAKLELNEKTVSVVLKPTASNQDVFLDKLWETADKISDVVINVVNHPITKRVFKGVVNQLADRAEVGAMEKAVDLLGDKILPGDIPAVKIAFMLISGFATIAKL